MYTKAIGNSCPIQNIQENYKILLNIYMTKQTYVVAQWSEIKIQGKTFRRH